MRSPKELHRLIRASDDKAVMMSEDELTAYKLWLGGQEPVVPVALEKEEPDMVNQPPHYADRKFETIDVIRDALTPEEFRGFLKGNNLKYMLREGCKPGAEEDVNKADWYLKRLLEIKETK